MGKLKFDSNGLNRAERKEPDHLFSAKLYEEVKMAYNRFWSKNQLIGFCSKTGKAIRSDIPRKNRNGGHSHDIGY